MSTTAEDMSRRAEKLEARLMALEGQLHEEREARKKAEKELQYHREVYRAIVETSPDAISLVDLQGNVVMTNRPGAAIVGYDDAEDIVGKKFLGFLAPEEQQRASEGLSDLVEGRTVRLKEYGLKKKDGSFALAEIMAAPVLDEDGRPRAMVAVARDITHRRKAEERALFLARVLDTCPYSVVIADRHGTIKYVNPATERLFGYDADELPGKNASIFNAEPNASAIQEDIFDTVGRGEVWKGEILNRKKDGETFPLAASVYRLDDEEGQFMSVVGFQEDITERKRAEEALSASKELFEKVFASEIDAAVFILDAQDPPVVLDANPAAVEMFGYGREELVGRSTAHLHVDEASLAEFQRELFAALAGHGFLRRLEHRMKRKDGTVFPTEHTVARLLGNEGQRVGWVSVVRDETERKLAGEALRRSEERFRVMFEQGGDLMSIAQMNGRTVWANAAWRTTLGCTPETQGDPIEKVHPDDRDQIILSLEAVNRDGSVVNVEYRYRTADGPYVVLDTMAVKIEVAGEPLIYVAARDVTDRSRAESAGLLSRKITEAANRHSSTPPLLRDVVWAVKRFTGCDAVGVRLLNGQGNIPYQAHTGFSREFYEIESPLSNRSDECMCINVVKGTADPSLPFFTSGGSFFSNGTTALLATVSEEEKGTTRNMCNAFGYESVALVPIRAAGGILGLIHVADPGTNMVPESDVEVLERVAMEVGVAIQRVRAREALRESEERFRRVFEDLPMGMALVGPDGKPFQVNDALCRMLGYQADELVEMTFAEFTHPDDVDKDRELASRVFAGEIPGNELEKRFIRKDGAIVWAHLIATAIRNQDGAIAYGLGMVEDITERKRADEALRAHEKQLRSLASQLCVSGEQERRRIANELHDQVGQTLALAQIKLGALAEQTKESEVTAALSEVRSLCGRAIQYTRSLTAELSPPVLHELGFEAGVEWLVDQKNRELDSIRFTFEDDGKPKPMEEDVRILLFQAVRELLVNVAKHAAAQGARVSLRRVDHEIEVKVEDDGVGFDRPAVEGAIGASTGFGLFSIRERLDGFGGRLELDSRPGAGTKAVIAVPLKPPKRVDHGEGI